jgi:hypothetical protein
MRKILIGLTGGLAAIIVFNHIRADLAASAIHKEYKRCETGYKLLGKKERFLKNLAESGESQEKHASTIKSMDEVEDSCAKYSKYFGEWGEGRIKPSDNLVWALLSRYEPEKLKQ